MKTKGPFFKSNMPGAVALIDMLGAVAIGRIIMRTDDSIDVDGGALAPYSARYGRKRVKSGRNLEVQLIWSGKMINAIEVLSKDGGQRRAVVRIGVGARDNRNNIAAWLQKRRKWFGLSKADRKVLVAFARANAKAIIDGKIRRKAPKVNKPPIRDD